jgi:hypothetical protein
MATVEGASEHNNKRDAKPTLSLAVENCVDGDGRPMLVKEIHIKAT